MKQYFIIGVIVCLILINGCNFEETINELNYEPTQTLESTTSSEGSSSISSESESSIIEKSGDCAKLLFQLGEAGSYITEFSKEIKKECYHKKICITGDSTKIRKCVDKPTKVYELGFSSCINIKGWYEVIDILRRCNVVNNPSTDFSWCGTLCTQCDKYDDTEKVKDSWTALDRYKITERTYCLWTVVIKGNNDQICNYIKNDETARIDCITG